MLFDMTGGNTKEYGRCNVYICNDLKTSIAVEIFTDDLCFRHKLTTKLQEITKSEQSFNSYHC